MGEFEQIDIQKAKELIGRGNVTIVDIRDPGSFQQGHIDNAVSVHDANITEFVNSTDKSIPVLCYCYMGFSSQNAAQYFKEQGFEIVYSLEGGYTRWEQDNGQGPE